MNLQDIIDIDDGQTVGTGEFGHARALSAQRSADPLRVAPIDQEDLEGEVEALEAATGVKLPMLRLRMGLR